MQTPPANAWSDLNVAIIGGSITGCAVAIELTRLGCNVTLFERSGEELKDRGAGIGVPKSIFETFIERDLIDRDTPYFPARTFVRRWRTAAEPRYGYLAWDQPNNFYLLNWSALYRNLRQRVPDRTYRTHQRVAMLEAVGEDAVDLSLTDGTRHRFDLVVCADGYTSLGRQTLFPEVRVEYVGYVLWRGGLPERDLRDSTPLESGIHALGYPGGHGIFYFVPALDGSIAPGRRVVNWAMYLTVPNTEVATLFTDRNGRVHEGSLPPGTMPLATERELKRQAQQRLPDYYSEIVAASEGTYVYAIYDCMVPAYRRGRICLAGDAGAFARPHTGAGALKGVSDAVTLSTALQAHADVNAALAAWDRTQTAHGNQQVRFGAQLGRALVKEIPDWSRMDPTSMAAWFSSIVTVDNAVFGPSNAPQARQGVS